MCVSGTKQGRLELLEHHRLLCAATGLDQHESTVCHPLSGAELLCFVQGKEGFGGALEKLWERESQRPTENLSDSRCSEVLAGVRPTGPAFRLISRPPPAPRFPFGYSVQCWGQQAEAGSIRNLMAGKSE